MKRYKLLKDLPTFRAGDIFVLANDGCLYLADNEDGKYCGMSMGGHWKKNVMAYHKNTLQHFPNILSEWFKEIEEPKKYWFIGAFGNIVQNEITKHYGDKYTDMTNEYENQKQIGNYFETKGEAEEVVKRLCAWKRLKDKGFRFQGWEDLEAIELPIKYYNNTIGFKLEDNHDVIEDLNTLFAGGEE